MTKQEWDKLSDREKQIKVAELCGWTNFKESDNELMGNNKYLDHGKTTDLHYVPDYLYDLNAMNEVLIETESALGSVYWIILATIFVKECSTNTDEHWAIHTATAKQRAEAFVRSIDNDA